MLVWFIEIEIISRKISWGGGEFSFVYFKFGSFLDI